MQELREREVVKVINGREFYRMELEDGTETHYLISKDGWILNPLAATFNRELRNCNIIKPNDNGYVFVLFTLPTGRIRPVLHRILAINFINNHLNLKLIDHINRDKSNNSLSNLRWINTVGNNNNIKAGIKSCKYDYISWQPENRPKHGLGRFKFTYRINGKETYIKSSISFNYLLAFRDRWITENNYPKCLDLNVI